MPGIVPHSSQLASTGSLIAVVQIGARPHRARGRRWTSRSGSLLIGEPRQPSCSTRRASGAPLLALYDVGARTAIQQMVLCQRCLSRLAAVSGGKRLAVDSTSAIGGYMTGGAVCSARRDSRDSVFAKSMKSPPVRRGPSRGVSPVPYEGRRLARGEIVSCDPS